MQFKELAVTYKTLSGITKIKFFVGLPGCFYPSHWTQQEKHDVGPIIYRISSCRTLEVTKIRLVQILQIFFGKLLRNEWFSKNGWEGRFTILVQHNQYLFRLVCLFGCCPCFIWLYFFLTVRSLSELLRWDGFLWKSLKKIKINDSLHKWTKYASEWNEASPTGNQR